MLKCYTSFQIYMHFADKMKTVNNNRNCLQLVNAECVCNEEIAAFTATLNRVKGDSS